MKIKKIGHCCLLIKTDTLTILTDPGAFSVEQNYVLGIDVILITHEHADHLHTGSIKAILKNNPKAVVITNSGVGRKLTEAGIPFSVLEGTSKTNIEEIAIEAFDCRHEEIFQGIGLVQNTGYFIDDKLFYPGDSFYNPGRAVDVLALPVAGPWCKVVDVVRYALMVKPKVAFPVHDGMLQVDKVGSFYNVPAAVLSEHGIRFVPMMKGDEQEF